MSNYFLSFTSTFESLLAGKITLEDLATGTMVFGCKPEHVLLPYDQIPIEVTLNNRVKTKHHEKANIVKRDAVDADVLTAWDAFAAQVRKARTETRLIFLNDIGHPSYGHFSRDMLRRGEQVFWKGDWQTLTEPVAAAIVPEPPAAVAPVEPLPDRSLPMEINVPEFDESLDEEVMAAIALADAQIDRGEPIDLASIRAEVYRRFV